MTTPCQQTSNAAESSLRFLRYPSVEALKACAKKPYDLTAPGALSAERLQRYVAEGCGYRLVYATERVDDDVLTLLQKLADEAGVVKQMERMQAGERLNAIENFPSEQRSVLHTALRDHFDHPQTAAAAIDITKRARQELDKLDVFLSDINRQQRFRTLVSIAIGGSDLGPRALAIALDAEREKGKALRFVSNVDPDDLLETLEGLDLASTLVLVISKSGTTIETLTNEALMRARFEQAGLSFKEHCLCVTQEGSPMDRPDQYLRRFYMWDSIGGRFSGSSMAGLVSLGFLCGMEVVREFLRGCHACDRHALEPNILKNLPLLGALLTIWNHNFLEIGTLAFIPYSHALSRFPAHLQQVAMESNGKRIDRRGQTISFQTSPVFWGEPGTNAQHSFYQLIHQGTAPVALEFVGFARGQRAGETLLDGTTSQEKLLSNLFAQAIALARGQADQNPNRFFPGNRPSHILLGQKLTPYALGVLLAYLEHKVAFEGFLWDINSFDQEGVQLGKVLATRIEGRFRARRTQKEEAPFPEADVLIALLERDAH